MRLYYCFVCNDWTWSNVKIPRGVWHNNNCQGNYCVIPEVKE
jgi:hypothetical protein